MTKFKAPHTLVEWSTDWYFPQIRYTYILCGHVTVFGIDSGPQRCEKLGHGVSVVLVSAIPGFPQIPPVDRSLPTGYKHSTAHARAPRGDTSRGYARDSFLSSCGRKLSTP